MARIVTAFDQVAVWHLATPTLLHRGIVFPNGYKFNMKDVQNAYGNNWSTDRSAAEAFADPNRYADSFGDPDEAENWAHGTGVVVSAWHDPQRGGSALLPYDMPQDKQYEHEKEIRVDSGTPLSVHSIRYRPAHIEQWTDVPDVSGREIRA